MKKQAFDDDVGKEETKQSNKPHMQMTNTGYGNFGGGDPQMKGYY